MEQNKKILIIFIERSFFMDLIDAPLLKDSWRNLKVIRTRKPDQNRSIYNKNSTLKLVDVQLRNLVVFD